MIRNAMTQHAFLAVFGEPARGWRGLLTVTLVFVTSLAPAAARAMVAVCTGQYAYAYHDEPYCSGLSNCKARIVYTSAYQAEAIGRRPCCTCMSHAANCAYDSDDAAAGAALIALGVLAVVGLTLTSNEFYLAPTLSFRNERGDGMPSPGLAMQVRKGFKFGSVGLGAHNQSAVTQYPFSYTGQPTTTYETVRWSALMDIAILLAHDDDRTWGVFIGPVGRAGDNSSIGGMVGFTARPFGRLKLDVRYELGTATNMIQVGLGLIYQKSSYWWEQPEEYAGP